MEKLVADHIFQTLQVTRTYRLFLSSLLETETCITYFGGTYDSTCYCYCRVLYGSSLFGAPVSQSFKDMTAGMIYAPASCGILPESSLLMV